VAVALWYPHYDPAVGPEHYETHLQAACGPNTRRFQLLDEAFAKHHPTDDHDYLAFVAVTPGMQGQGLGSALLQAHLQELDRTGQSAFLEASSADNRRLYERLGFDAAPARHLPDDGPPYWTCWRPPSS
jgi:predicted N-acetyltransferase YhbS